MAFPGRRGQSLCETGLMMQRGTGAAKLQRVCQTSMAKFGLLMHGVAKIEKVCQLLWWQWLHRATPLPAMAVVAPWTEAP